MPIEYNSCYSLIWGLPCGSAGKESACNVGDPGLIPGLGRPPGEGKNYLLQYSGLENPMDCIVRWFTKSQTQLSDFHFHLHINMECNMEAFFLFFLRKTKWGNFYNLKNSKPILFETKRNSSILK